MRQSDYIEDTENVRYWQNMYEYAFDLHSNLPSTCQERRETIEGVWMGEWLCAYHEKSSWDAPLCGVIAFKNILKVRQNDESHRIIFFSYVGNLEKSFSVRTSDCWSIHLLRWSTISNSSRDTQEPMEFTHKKRQCSWCGRIRVPSQHQDAKY